MAQRTTVTVTCDLFHEVETEGTETLAFSVDGAPYEIDVCDGHAKEAREMFTEYIECGRKVAASTTGHRSRRVRSRSDASDIRAWAKERDIEVSERGRIPVSVVAQYEAASA